MSMITWEIFEFGFIQRALIAGIAISAICSVIGLFLGTEKTVIVW